MNKKIELVVDPGAGEQFPLRFDQYVSSRVEGLTRSQFQARSSQLSTNGKKCRSSAPVLPGDTLCFILEDQPSLEVLPEELPLDILFENHDVLVVNKPRGVVVHPGPGNREGTLVGGLLYHVQQFDGFEEGDTRPGIVHRLDKETTGVLIVAKTVQAHSFLANQFKERQTHKIYYAVSKITPKGKQGIHSFGSPREVRNTLGRDSKNRQKFAVLSEGSGRGKEAVSIVHLRGLNSEKTLGLFEIRLITGRTHQIRVHLSFLGFPILGDPIYGRDSGVLMLHARSLTITLPGDIEPSTFKAPVPEDFIEEFQRRIVEIESK